MQKRRVFKTNERKIDSIMSDSEELASTSSETKIDNIDPELDIRSELFNPLKALLSPEIQIPVKDAPQYDNVAQYESAMKKQQTAETVSSFLLWVDKIEPLSFLSIF